MTTRRSRIAVMIMPVPGETKEVYTGTDGWKNKPEVNDEVIVADVGGSGKMALGKVISHDSKKHTYSVLILREYTYAEEDQSNT